MAFARSSEVSQRLVAALLAMATLAVAVLLLSNDSSPAGDDGTTSGPVRSISPLWIVPGSFRELIDQSDAVVDGRVTAIEPGEPIKQPPRKGLPEGAIPDIPTQRIQLEVDEVIHGTAPAMVTLYQTGGRESARRGSTRVIADGDPEFEVGQRHVLFLERRDSDGTYNYFGPFGRFAVDGDERLQAVEHHRDGPAKLHGVPASEVGARIREERSPR